jgi:hypothetical protein
MGVFQDFAGYAAHENLLQAACSGSAHHNHIIIFLLGNIEDGFYCAAEFLRNRF